MYKDDWSNYWYNYWYNYWNRNVNPNNMITRERAIEIALEALPGEVIKVELDIENGRLVYEVYIRTPYGIYEVEIDAYTGRIIDIDRE